LAKVPSPNPQPPFAVRDNFPKSDAPREINNNLGLIFCRETSKSVENGLGVTKLKAFRTPASECFTTPEAAGRPKILDKTRHSRTELATLDPPGPIATAQDRPPLAALSGSLLAPPSGPAL
jgi:hypothetical protein